MRRASELSNQSNRNKNHSIQSNIQKEHDKHPEHPHKHHGLNMNQIPPNWTLAKNHAKARETKPEIVPEEGVEKDYAICECCGYELIRKPIDIWTPSIELGFLGAGFPLFYNYIYYCCIMLASLFIIQGIPNIIINLSGSFCNKTMLEFYEAFEENKHHPKDDFLTPCPYSFTNKLSVANILDKMKGQGSVSFHFSTVAMIVQFILCIFFRKKQKEIEIQVDKNFITPSDYTVWVKHIPKTLKNPVEELKKLFTQDKYEVAKIVLIYNITKLEEKEKIFKQLIKEKQKYLRKNEGKPGYPEEAKIEEDIKKIEQEIHTLEKDIINDPSYFSGQAFVSFEREADKDRLFKTNPPNCFKKFLNFFIEGNQEFNDSFTLNGDKLKIYIAPEPNDVDWEFAHCENAEKNAARLQSFLKWIAVIGVSFSTICLITYFQSHKIDHVNEEMLELEKESKKHGKVDKHEEEKIHKTLRIITLFSFIISCTIVLFNKFALPFIIHHIVDHEKWSTKTKLNISFAFKLTIALFFNTALITYLIEIILFNNFYGIGGGMVYNEELVFIFNAIIPSLAWIVDPWSIIKNYQRSKEVDKINSVLTQAEANQLMEHPDYAMGKRYADIMKTMWFTFFFCPVVPIGTLFSFFGLIFYYYTDKYNLIYRRTVKESIGAELSLEMIELLEYSVVLHCLGNFMFKWMLSKYLDLTSLLLFLISIVVSILPLDALNSCLFNFEQKAEDLKYSDEQYKFDTDYDRENPITRHQALADFTKARTLAKL